MIDRFGPSASHWSSSPFKQRSYAKCRRRVCQVVREYQCVRQLRCDGGRCLPVGFLSHTLGMIPFLTVASYATPYWAARLRLREIVT
jgi:hypothetical protein